MASLYSEIKQYGYIISRRYARFYSCFYFSSPSLEPGGTNAFYRSALKCPKSTCFYSNALVGHNKLADQGLKRQADQGLKYERFKVKCSLARFAEI